MGKLYEHTFEGSLPNDFSPEVKSLISEMQQKMVDDLKKINNKKHSVKDLKPRGIFSNLN